MAFSEVNVDPRTEDITINVDTISISSSESDFGRNVTRHYLVEMANSLRKDYPRRMRFGQVQEVADAITLVLRENGFKFHYAFIPPQKTKGGVINLSIVEVSLSDVRVLNDGYLPDVKITRLFDKLLYQPLYQPDIDHLLRSLRRNRSYDFFAYYSRGSKPKSVRLNIKVAKKKYVELSLSIDNYGSSLSGTNRTLATMTLHNPSKRFDNLNLGLMQSYGVSKNTYGYALYETPLFNLDHELGVYLSNSVFDIEGGFSGLGIEGDSSVGEISYTNHFYSSEVINQSWSLSYAEKSSDYTSDFMADIAEPDEEATSIGLSWRLDIATNLNSHFLQSSFYSGEFDVNGVSEGESGFQFFNLYYQYYQRFIEDPSSFAFEGRLRYQGSNHRLPSFERMSLTGGIGVRGFEPGQFSADTFNTVSLALHLPRFSSYRLYGGDFLIYSNVFVERASGTQYGIDKRRVNDLQFSSVGLSLTALWGKHFSTSVTYAMPLGTHAYPISEFRQQYLSLLMNIKW